MATTRRPVDRDYRERPYAHQLLVQLPVRAPSISALHGSVAHIAAIVVCRRTSTIAKSAPTRHQNRSLNHTGSPTPDERTVANLKLVGQFKATPAKCRGNGHSPTSPVSTDQAASRSSQRWSSATAGPRDAPGPVKAGTRQRAAHPRARGTHPIAHRWFFRIPGGAELRVTITRCCTSRPLWTRRAASGSSSLPVLCRQGRTSNETGKNKGVNR